MRNATQQHSQHGTVQQVRGNNTRLRTIRGNANAHTQTNVTQTNPQAARVTWLTHAWSEVRETFNLMSLPPKVLITCGWPSRRSRGKLSSRNPTEILMGEWRDNENEAAIVSVHPERFRSPNEVVLSILHEMSRQVSGRSGVLALGLLHDKLTGEVTVLENEDGLKTLASVQILLRKLGSLPVGFAEVPEPKPRTTTNATRMRKWVCSACGAILRIASDTAGSEFAHTVHRPHAALVLVTPEMEEKNTSPPTPTISPGALQGPHRGKTMAAHA